MKINMLILLTIIYLKGSKYSIFQSVTFYFLKRFLPEKVPGTEPWVAGTTAS